MCGYRPPPTLHACVERLLGSGRFEWAAKVRSKGAEFGKRLQHSLALEADPAHAVCGEEAGMRVRTGTLVTNQKSEGREH